MIFYLGVHAPSWLATARVPLFVSRRRLEGRRTLPRAAAAWALDSGGFTELTRYGAWQRTPREYAAEVIRYRDEIGQLAFAAPMDFMCEPAALEATGFTVAEHQRYTIEVFGELRARLGSLVIPVVQGWTEREYLAHVFEYARAGFDLHREDLVGVGSICRRQDTEEAARILHSLERLGLRLHAFGLKLAGLALAADALISADSMAWSYRARRDDPMPGHTHASCSTCLPYALAWRDKIERRLLRPRQRRLAI